MNRMPQSDRQAGIALVTALVVLLIVTIIGISSLSSSLMQTKVAAGTKEHYSAFQAAETALTVAQSDDLAFVEAITQGTTVPIDMSSVSIDPSGNTTFEADILYDSEGTLAPDSSIGKFKPQFFIMNGRATRDGSGARAVHSQGYRILSPGS